MSRPPSDVPPTTPAAPQPAAHRPAQPGDPRAGTIVGDLSEAELLERFLPLLARPGAEHVLLGPGDDCAVVAAPDGRFVITTDTQVQDQDFRTAWPSGVVPTGFDTGVKCAAQNLADVAAMGAVPTAVVVSLTLPPGTPVAWPEDFARGLVAGFEDMGAARCAVVGGDLGAGRELSVTATVTGDLEGREPVRRSGAREGGVVALAGTTGRAAAGVALLDDTRYRPGADPALDELARAQLRPCAPVPAGPVAARGGATAMIDLSDGLLRDAGRVAAASGVVVDLDAGAVAALAEPLLPAGLLLGTDPRDWVLGGGEDHGLLAVFPQGVPLPAGFRAIGSCAPAPPAHDGPHPRVLLDGRAPHLALGHPVGEGWDHFEP
ncbi:thiamine-monophosphate kinase [Kocuria dechangensis]|uniref:Thiamine-monophosphate kinase n=1 Tax=Kocuria dechangensis TaxID=1176249 RepID=A0A917H245_9MICC|nr:thiamine-phosphate kinase [Kocuria dechangensis]GGG65119.1 thiamine-monophosphate kinase [Kocuria dechangensis]